MKVTYYVAASLDGFIAKADGDVSWLEQLGIPMEDTGYDVFFSSVDGLIMGRKTYQLINTFGDWPYGSKPVWVCSHQSVNASPGINLQDENTPQLAFEAAEAKGISHLWCVGGGNLASSLIEIEKLSNIYLSLMPIILGDGINLFSQLNNAQSIRLKQQNTHPSGMIQLEYQINSFSASDG
ncbi:dihydrofolate reductase [Aliikangiella marina]|uniref:Dihydrofolate reductase n=1 Tax=Aliikangiella marina TaxID=1712262 RepID=A0A545TA45_9GAMM|nr:dihydrofolate reductase family protein [Aliikangiella marina]TQV74092.1 dihydrofolate reductase [Aliikangiella marina]